MAFWQVFPFMAHFQFFPSNHAYEGLEVEIFSSYKMRLCLGWFLDIFGQILFMPYFLLRSPQTNAKFEAEKSNVRQAVRGEFCMALDCLASEKSGLMNQLSEVRLKLAELQSEFEAAEKQYKARADEEAAKIHARYVWKRNSHL